MCKIRRLGDVRLVIGMDNKFLKKLCRGGGGTSSKESVSAGGARHGNWPLAIN